jgi:glycosyltransferase involved in cell wall biosynthesis
MRNDHLLIYEPRAEGHHLSWLRFITEDLLAAGMKLSLAVDLRTGSSSRVADHLNGLSNHVTLLSAYDTKGNRHDGGGASSIRHCLKESGAENVFLCALDEVASSWFRKAAFGCFPPAQLRGRIGGIYHRPRFLSAPKWHPHSILKAAGFARLTRAGWFRQVLFVDEFLCREQSEKFRGAPFFFLPDPCPDGYKGEMGPARQKLGLPHDKCIFLFYGVGHRRKGLHLAVAAMLDRNVPENAMLLCAGQLDPDPQTMRGLQTLVSQGRALLLNRYVTVEEEFLCFSACDAVLLPYIHHFGTSGVLSRAMSAAKMVVVSDEELLGRLTRENELGLLFPTGNAPLLTRRLAEVCAISPERRHNFTGAAQRYALKYSRAAYRTALTASLLGAGGRGCT